jgi:outer membrane lipoprotein SlyB
MRNPNMLRTTRLIAVLAATVVGLSACVAPPPRHRVVYHETDRAYVDRGYPDRDYDRDYRERAYEDRDYADRDYRDEPGRACHFCGTVREVDRVHIRQGTSGGGALLGAINGGAIGNQFGAGSGRAAATAAGVIGGAAVGNEVEEDNARRASGSAWRFRVELDDGRWATVTQYDNPGFHAGDRVVVSGQHLEYARR